MIILKPIHVRVFQILISFILYKYLAESGVLKRIENSGTKQNFSESGTSLKRRIRVYYVMPQGTVLDKDENKKRAFSNQRLSKVTDKITTDLISIAFSSRNNSEIFDKRPRVTDVDDRNYTKNSSMRNIRSSSSNLDGTERHNSVAQLKPTVKNERSIKPKQSEKTKGQKHHLNIQRNVNFLLNKMKLLRRDSRTQNSLSENNFTSTSLINELGTKTSPLSVSIKSEQEAKTSPLYTSIESVLKTKISPHYTSTKRELGTKNSPFYTSTKSERGTKTPLLYTSTESKLETETSPPYTSGKREPGTGISPLYTIKSGLETRTFPLYTSVKSEWETKTSPLYTSMKSEQGTKPSSLLESNNTDSTIKSETVDELSLWDPSVIRELESKDAPLSESNVTGPLTVGDMETGSSLKPTNYYPVTSLLSQPKIPDFRGTESSRTGYFTNSETETKNTVSANNIPDMSDKRNTEMTNPLELGSFTSEIITREDVDIQKPSLLEPLNTKTSTENEVNYQKATSPVWNVMETSTESEKETQNIFLTDSTIIVPPLNILKDSQSSLSAESSGTSVDGQEENGATIFTNITSVREVHDDQNNVKMIEFETINETETEMAHQIVQFLEQNVTSPDGSSYLYINISKSELKIIIPLLQNGSMSIYDIENRLVESGYFKNITRLRDQVGFYGLITFCEWVRLCLTRHTIEISVAVGLIIFVLLLLLLLCFLKKRRTKTTSKYSEIFEEKPRYSAVKTEKPSIAKRDDVSPSSSSSPEEISSLPTHRKQARKSIRVVDNLLSHGRTFKEEKHEAKRLLSSSSDESGGERDLKDGRKEKKEKIIKSIQDDSAKRRLQTKKEKKPVETKQIAYETSKEEQDPEIKLKKKTPRYSKEKTDVGDRKKGKRVSGPKSTEKTVESTENSDTEDRRKMPEPKSTKKVIQLPAEPETRDGYERRRKPKAKSVKMKKQARPVDEDVLEDEEAAVPTTRRLSRWMQRVFKVARPEEIGDGVEGKDSSQQSSTLSQRSSTEVDKTYTSKRQKLLTFVSPSKRRKVERFRARTKRSVFAPSVRTVVSESDFSSDVAFPPIDAGDLKSRIVATGDCKKIDDMLVRGDWERSFFTAHDIEVIGDRGEDLQLHDPEERRKLNAAKIADSQAQMLGTLSKGSSDHSLRDVVGRSIHKAESTACSPRAITASDLKARRRM